RFGEDIATDVGYQFSMIVDEQRLEFDKRPNWPWGQLDNRGLERPLPDLTDGQEHRLQLALDDDIATLYVDDTALCTRFNTPAGSAVVPDVIEGAVEVGATSVSTSATQSGGLQSRLKCDPVLPGGDVGGPATPPGSTSNRETATT